MFAHIPKAAAGTSQFEWLFIITDFSDQKYIIYSNIVAAQRDFSARICKMKTAKQKTKNRFRFKCHSFSHFKVRSMVLSFRSCICFIFHYLNKMLNRRFTNIIHCWLLTEQFKKMRGEKATNSQFVRFEKIQWMADDHKFYAKLICFHWSRPDDCSFIWFKRSRKREAKLKPNHRTPNRNM